MGNLMKGLAWAGERGGEPDQRERPASVEENKRGKRAKRVACARQDACGICLEGLWVFKDKQDKELRLSLDLHRTEDCTTENRTGGSGA